MTSSLQVNFHFLACAAFLGEGSMQERMHIKCKYFKLSNTKNLAYSIHKDIKKV